MKLRHFSAERYKSLLNFAMDIDDLTILIGENNGGKSNILHALELFLSSTVRGVNENTFFNRDTSNPIRLTGRFTNLTETEMNKLGPWTVDGELTVIKEYVIDDSGKISVSYFARMKVPREPWVQEDFEDYNKREVLKELPIGKYMPLSGKISKQTFQDMIKKYITENETDVDYVVECRRNPAGYKQVLDGYLPELHMIHAVQEATEELKTGSTALLGKILAIVVRRIAQVNPAFQELRSAINKIKTIIQGETPEEKMAEITELETDIEQALSVWGGVRVNISVEAPDVDRLFQLGTNVTLDDGLPTSVEDKGHGLQRSLIFALMRVWARESRRGAVADTAIARERSNFFAFEEPELFLHPQICRATYEALKAISGTEQILLCTHSSQFVNLEDYRNLAIIRKRQGEGTKACRVTRDLFEQDDESKKHFNMIRYFNPDRNEVFFASKVALTEGPTEKAIFPVLARRVGVFNHSISVIDCEGKGNLILYMKVLNAYRIPYIVVYDEDPGQPAFAENQRIEKECDQNIAQTYMVPGKLEKLLAVSEVRAKEVGKPYAAIEKFSDETVPVPVGVQKLMKAVYTANPPSTTNQAVCDPGQKP